MELSRVLANDMSFENAKGRALVDGFTFPEWDIPGTIKQVSSFFSKTYSDGEITRLADHVSFQQFQANPMVNVPDLRTDIGDRTTKLYQKGKSGRLVRRSMSRNSNETERMDLEERKR